MPNEDKINYKDISKVIQDANVIYLNIDPFCKYYFDDILQSNAKIIVDIHVYKKAETYHQPFIELADIIIVSAVNIEAKKEFLTDLINDGKECVILTSGSKGIFAMNQAKEMIELASYKINNYEDPNGAGDAFTVGFTTYYLQSKNFLDALQYGLICGGLACTSKTLFPKEVTKAIVEKNYKMHKKNNISI